MPDVAVDGTLIVMFVVLAVQPKRLDGPNDAAQPAGSPVTVNRTRSKKLSLRWTVTGTVTTPPLADTLMGLVAVLTVKDPSAATRATSSNGSWVLSGSVEVAQSRLPRYRSDARTSVGVARGRLALKSATAPVTAGAAIDVPDEYP